MKNSWVLLAATSTFILNSLHSSNTGKFRKAAKVSYPAAYAPSSRTDVEAHNFNCAQRAHANFTENHPSFLGALLIAGLRYPLTSAVMGAVWTLGRYLYMVGYSRGGDGKGRYNGIFYMLSHIRSMGMAGYVSVMMALQKQVDGWVIRRLLV